MTTPDERVRLKGVPFDIQLPRLAADRQDLYLYWLRRKGDVRSSAAVLGMCLRGVAHGVSWERCECEPAVFGGNVWEWARRQGITEAEVLTAGLACWQRLSDEQLTEQEIANRAGFSAAPGAPPTGSDSDSASSTADTPGGSPA